MGTNSCLMSLRSVSPALVALRTSTDGGLLRFSAMSRAWPLSKETGPAAASSRSVSWAARSSAALSGPAVPRSELGLGPAAVNPPSPPLTLAPFGASTDASRDALKLR